MLAAGVDCRLYKYVTHYRNNVLVISDGIDDMGPAKWDPVLCLLLA